MLVSGLRSGDARAIEILYTAYFDRLYAFIFHSIKQNQAAAEDITQDVFVSALKSAKNFKGQSRLYTWLAGIAHHKINDYFRNAQKELLQKNGTFVLHDVVRGDNPPASANLETGELNIDVIRALAKLPPDYRQVLLFKYVEEIPVKEISRIMDRSPKAIDGLLTRARKLLRENISGLL